MPAQQPTTMTMAMRSLFPRRCDRCCATARATASAGTPTSAAARSISLSGTPGSPRSGSSPARSTARSRMSSTSEAGTRISSSSDIAGGYRPCRVQSSRSLQQVRALERRSHTRLGHDSHAPIRRVPAITRLVADASTHARHRRRPARPPSPIHPGTSPSPAVEEAGARSVPRPDRIGRISARMMRSPQPEASQDGPWSPGARARLRPSGATESILPRTPIDRHHRVPPGRHHSGRHAHPARALRSPGRAARHPRDGTELDRRWGRWAAGTSPTDVRTAARSYCHHAPRHG